MKREDFVVCKMLALVVVASLFLNLNGVGVFAQGQVSLSRWTPDLAGEYCSRLRYGGGCCRDRMDECSMPILGTSCYCDSFCDRTHSSDCCPDYYSHCRGQEAVAPPVDYQARGCLHNGRWYRPSESVRINCNDCKCTGVGESVEFLCSAKKCLIEQSLVEHVNRANLGWTARNYSNFWGRTLEEGQGSRLGTLHPSQAVMDMVALRGAAVAHPPPPASFDARLKWPDYISQIQDQKWCGSSWAVSTVSVSMDRFAIMSKGAEKPQLSVQHLADCANHHHRVCEGGEIDQAWAFARKKGMILDECYKTTGHCHAIKANLTTFLETSCPWVLNRIRANKDPVPLYRMGPAYRLAEEKDIMHEIMTSGPVQATMQVFQDLFSYDKGVYKHSPLTESERTAYHSVRIIGWGEENVNGRNLKYWLVANSWGEWWGEEGFFRILRGVNECHIEDFVLGSWAYTDIRKVRRKYRRFFRRSLQKKGNNRLIQN